MFEGDEHHKDIINRLAEMFPHLGKEAVYLHYSRMLASLGAVNWPLEEEQIKAQLDVEWGEPAKPYKRKIDISYENEDRPGEQIRIGMREGKLSIGITQADGEGWEASIDPNNPDDSTLEKTSEPE